MPHVIITGAFGFLGRHIAAEMETRGWQVTGLGRPFGDRVAPRSSGSAQWQMLDLPSPALDELLDRLRPDALVHAAGPASVPHSVADPVGDFWSSAAVFCDVLNAVRLHSPQTRVLLLSSAAVYGNPETLPVSEGADLNPISPYGYHKLMCEKLAEEFHVVYGSATGSVRIFSAYGAGLQRQVLWDICRKALSNRLVRLIGTGRETRDFIHAADVARGVATVVERGRFRCEAYNLATGIETGIGDLAEMLVTALGLNRDIEFDGTVRTGDPLRWRADLSRISALGYAPTISIDTGVAEYASWIAAEERSSKWDARYAL